MGLKYSVVCQGKVEKERVICHGWGSYGEIDDRCPVCHEKVFVTNAITVLPLGGS